MPAVASVAEDGSADDPVEELAEETDEPDDFELTE